MVIERALRWLFFNFLLSFHRRSSYLSRYCSEFLIKVLSRQLIDRQSILAFSKPVFDAKESDQFDNLRSVVLTRILDKRFGLDVKKIHEFEKSFPTLVERGSDVDAVFWGLRPEMLWSNYSRLNAIIELGKNRFGERFRIIELGCGVSRFGVFLDHCFPEISYLGIEIEPSRVSATIPLIKNSKTIKYRISDFRSFPFEEEVADIYFLFNPTKDRKILEQLLAGLKRGMKKNQNAILVGWSRFSLKEMAPWLVEIANYKIGKHQIYKI